MLVVMYTEVY